MKATPIACTMYVPAPPQPRYRPRRSLVDVPLPPPVVIKRPPGLLANLAVKLQEACGVPDSEWVRRRHPHSVSCRRAAAVVLRRVILPGMVGPSSYPDIAAAMGRRHHSSVITMCHQFFDDPAAEKAARWMEMLVEREGYRLSPMCVVVGAIRRTPKELVA